MKTLVRLLALPLLVSGCTSPPEGEGEAGEGEGEAGEGEGEGEAGEGEGEGEVGACSGDCAAGRYTACTCGTTDPCGWAEDGACDARCIEFIPDIFYDFFDCTTGNGADVVVSGPELGAATTPNTTLVTDIAPTVFTEMVGMGAGRAVYARETTGFGDSPVVLVELVNDSNVPWCNVRATSLALFSADNTSLLSDDTAIVMAPTQIVMPSGTHEECISPGHIGYLGRPLFGPLSDVPARVEVGLEGEGLFAYDAAANIVPESYTASGGVVSIVVRNTGANPATLSVLSTFLFVALDSSERPVGLGFLNDAPFSTLQANQTMTMTTSSAFGFEGSATRMRVYVPFGQ
jgi:hypothetical protein